MVVEAPVRAYVGLEGCRSGGPGGVGCHNQDPKADRPEGSVCRQDEINQLMIALARAGRRVVRLKSGDPMVFGRAGEEIAACRTAGIPVEVVPGITAAQAAASRLGSGSPEPARRITCW